MVGIAHGVRRTESALSIHEAWKTVDIGLPKLFMYEIFESGFLAIQDDQVLYSWLRRFQELTSVEVHYGQSQDFTFNQYVRVQ